MPDRPAFSVVITCWNPGPQLPPTMASIRAQRGVSLEIIAVDLGSTDGSRAWLEAEGSRLAAVIRQSPDGEVAGLNQAIALARGEWLLFLQAGDRLVGEVILSEVLNWMKKTEAGVVAGEVAGDDGYIGKLHSRVNAVAGNFVPAGGTFYRATLFAENGGFDPAFRVQADYEFNVRLWKGLVRFKPIPLRVAAIPVRPDNAFGPSRRYREQIAVRHRYFSALRCLPWDALSLLRWLGAALRPRRT